MALEFKKPSKWWYAAYRENGRKRSHNLGIKIEGECPAKVWEDGDKAYRKSRKAAERAHDEFMADIKASNSGAKRRELVLKHETRFIEALSCRKIEQPTIKDLPQSWYEENSQNNPSKTKSPTKHQKHCMQVLKKFAEFMESKWPERVYLLELDRDHVSAFLDAEYESGVTPRTWNFALVLLKSALRSLASRSDAYEWLRNVKQKPLETVHRKPFTAEEVQAIKAVVQDDDLVRPLIITALNTALRLGDTCRLRWADVDLKAGFMEVKTSKTGKVLDLPILPELQRELKRASTKKDKTGFVWPEAAKMYQGNPTGISKKISNALERAFESIGSELQNHSREEITRRAGEYVESYDNPKKAEQILKMLQVYLDGSNGRETAKALDCVPSKVSDVLHELEEHTGCRIVRTRNTRQDVAKRKAMKDVLTAPRKRGQRKASIRNFHALRVTGLTNMLAAGVPEKIVLQVSGHRSEAVLMEHYDQRSIKQRRENLRAAMEKGLGDGPTREEQLKELLLKMNPGPARDAALEILLNE